MKVVVDTRSGDGKNGPLPAIEGAHAALLQSPNLEVTLVGPEEMLRGAIADLGYANPRLDILHAKSVVGMKDSVLQARHNKDSSMYVGIQAVANGNGDVFIGSGNTGANIGIAYKEIRPIFEDLTLALVTHMPTVRGPKVIGDVGANRDCDMQNLVDIALMSRIYAQAIGIDQPSVYLTNIGEEATKGDKLTKAADPVFQEQVSGYAGYIEPNTFLMSKETKADVIVNNGFAMNIGLKFAEGMAKLVGLNIVPILAARGLDVQEILQELAQKIYPSDLAHAYLLGLRRLFIKLHGNCDDPVVYSSAILSGERAYQYDLIGQIRAGLPARQAA